MYAIYGSMAYIASNKFIPLQIFKNIVEISYNKRKRFYSIGAIMTEKPRNKGGRPRNQFLWGDVVKMVGAGCLQEEIAAYLSVSADTITSECKKNEGCTFSEFRTKKSKMLNVILRRKIEELIEKGDRTIIIFAAKNLLGWSDNPVVIDDKEPFVIKTSRSEITLGFREKTEQKSKETAK